MMKAAFAGCGGIMREHHRQLASFEDVEIVGHCDTDTGRANQAAEAYGGRAYSDCHVMCGKEKPDALFIAVPPFAHGEIERAAIERGIHFFVETPIALDAKTAKELAKAVRSAKIMTSAGYCYRYCEPMAMARRMLKGKAISLVSGRCNGSMPSVPWRRKMDKSGGQIVEQSTHCFDLLRYLCGEVAEVHAIASRGAMTKVKDYDVDDSSVVAMRLKNGATASVTSTCVANNGGIYELEVYTPEGTFRFHSGSLTVCEDGRTTRYHPSNNMYREQDRAFVDAVISGKRGRIRSTYHDALKTLLLTVAANESIRTGLPVKP